jgi:NAD(P)-dependent dehydrogenase (short-subunit alcohol dehydrogenase family)
MPFPSNPSVLITGASRGLGEALCQVFADNGWQTFPLVRHAADAERLKARHPLTCAPIVTDLSGDDAKATISAALAAHASALDVLINCAGFAGSATLLSEVTSAEIDSLFQVHCLGALRATQAAMPWLLRAGQPFVVNISSRLGSLSKNASGEFADGSFSYAYRMAKAAQNMFSVCLAQEFAASGLSVFSVHPGRIQTRSGAAGADLSAPAAAERFYRWLQKQPPSPQCRYVEPEVGELPW